MWVPLWKQAAEMISLIFVSQFCFDGVALESFLMSNVSDRSEGE